MQILNYYTLEGGLALAEKIKNRLKNQLDKLALSPESYPISPLEPRLRQMVVQKLPFKVYFLVDKSQKTVHIFGILHTSRDHQALFEELNFFND